MTRSSGIALVATVAALLAGCSSSGPAFHPPSHPPKSSHPVKSSTPPATPAPGRQIVTVRDLPVGWSRDHHPHAATQYLPPCFTTAMSTDHADSSASRSFAFSGRAPFFGETVAYFGASGAKQAFAAATDRLQRCRKLSFKVKNVRVAGTMSATSFDAEVDASRGYTANLMIGPAPLAVSLLVVRQGSELVGFSYERPGAVATPVAFALLYDAALQRLKKS